MSRTISFTKMSGSGNDFILVDNRAAVLAEDQLVPFTRAMCPRRTSVGADGAIFLALTRTPGESDLDFRMRYFNADGSEAAMCGNGARCIAAFAHALGAVDGEMRFATPAGPIQAWITNQGVKVELTPPSAIEKRALPGLPKDMQTAYFIDTGVPHAVLFVEQIADVDVRERGRKVREHAAFAPAGANANFVSPSPSGNGDGSASVSAIAIRTYERGVEDETLACGTGAVACALVAAHVRGLGSPVRVKVASGDVLVIHFDGEGPSFTKAYLEGPARTVYRAEVAWP